MTNKITVTKPQPKKPAPSLVPSQPFLFDRMNYMILFAGLALMALGFILMSGGNQPPDVFDEGEVYSFRRTTLSSGVVVLGLLVVLYSIFAKDRTKSEA